MVFLEILKYTLPSVVVFLTAYFLLKQQNERELAIKDKEVENDHKKLNNEILLPIRLQAYERLILFLERIHPHQLIIRHSNPSYSSFQFQTQLIKAIRDEFEHNLSQQLYVSEESWRLVQKAKEECIKQINFAASKLDSQASSKDLGSLVIQSFASISPNPFSLAIGQMKTEVQKGL
ncbi:MAG: hypothetical protein GQ527_07430 [Bacteroidales bacterium]|nr:hypothetical protein [Bacteroidales bacterium]